MGGKREERGGRGGRAVHAGRERKASERQLPAGRWMPGFPGAESPEDSGLGERVMEGALKGRRRRGEVARSRPLGPTPVWAARARFPAPPGVSPCVQPAAPRARDQRDPIDGGHCPQCFAPAGRPGNAPCRSGSAPALSEEWSRGVRGLTWWSPENIGPGRRIIMFSEAISCL